MPKQEQPTFTLHQQLYRANMIIGGGDPETDRGTPPSVVILATRDGSEPGDNRCNMTMLAAALLMSSMKEQSEGEGLAEVMERALNSISTALNDIMEDAPRHFATKH